MTWIKDEWTYNIEHMRLWADDYGRVYVAYAEDIKEVSRAFYLYLFLQGFLEYGEEWFTDTEMLDFVQGPMYLTSVSDETRQLIRSTKDDPDAERIWVVDL